MREKAIAEELKKQGCQVLIDCSKSKKESREIPMAGADIYVFDGKFDFSKEDIEKLKRKDARVVFIDTWCEGAKIADLVIMPNEEFKTAVIRKEILNLKKKKHTGKNLILMTGGTDPEGVMLKLIEWLKNAGLKINVIALPGKQFSFKKELKKIKLPPNFKIKEYDEKEIAKADYAVSTYGQSIFELVYLKIPSICVSHSKENLRVLNNLAKRCKIINAGYYKKMDSARFKKLIARLLKQKSGHDLIDGRGAERISKLIINNV